MKSIYWAIICFSLIGVFVIIDLIYLHEKCNSLEKNQAKIRKILDLSSDMLIRHNKYIYLKNERDEQNENTSKK